MKRQSGAADCLKFDSSEGAKQGVDNTIANVALPHIQGSLSAAQDQVAWVLTLYIGMIA